MSNPNYTIKGKKSDWSLVIGLEVHCQISSNAKLFSGAATSFGANPNSQVSFVDAGYPGVLPVINQYCIEQAVKTSLALNGTINKVSYFDRKHYFYPDLPLGYQISQFYYPIMTDGSLEITLKDGLTKIININRLHIEQDAGKLMHDYDGKKSLVDLNRAGVGLMEIVSDPDMSSPAEAVSYLNKLRSIVRYIGSCDGNMEQGSLRCDVNVSVREVGETGYRNRVEVKNVNSMRFVMQAIEYEFKRQVECWENGGQVVQETRLFDENKVATVAMRNKENEADYKYIRDPDLLAVKLTDDYIKKLADELPELPDQKLERFMKEYKLKLYDAEVLVRDKETALYFEQVLADNDYSVRDYKLASNWITTNLFSWLNKTNTGIADCPITAKHLACILNLLESDIIAVKTAKDIFELLVDQPDLNIIKYIKDNNLEQIADTKELEDMVSKVLADNQDKVIEIKSGKDKLMGWLVGEVMKLSHGKANPGMVNQMLRKKIF